MSTKRPDTGEWMVRGVTVLVSCAVCVLPVGAQQLDVDTAVPPFDARKELMAQALFGGGMAALGGLGLAYLGSAVAGPCDCDDPGLGEALLGFALGTTIGATLGVQAGASASRGRGNTAATFIGSALGLTSFVFLAFTIDSGPPALAVAGLFGLPTAGAMLAFHASRPPEAPLPPPTVREAEPDLRVAPLLRRDGAAGLALSLRH